MKWLLIKKLGMNSDASWLIIQKNMIIRLQKYLTISYHNNLLGEQFFIAVYNDSTALLINRIDLEYLKSKNKVKKFNKSFLIKTSSSVLYTNVKNI